MDKIEVYIDEVLNNIVAEESMKKRIGVDLLQHLNELATTNDVDSVLFKMGNPKDVAREFMDSIYEDKAEIIDRLVQERSIVNRLKKDCYEYRSKIKIFGLPLVHIKLNRRGFRPSVAKGIIAIGTVSVGVLSIGALPIGIISIGAAAIGVISLGGWAVGLAAAIGGIAVGTLAVGGVAIGFGAIGGCAVGKIAIGGYARGTVAVGATAIGKYTMVVHHIGAETRDAIATMISNAYPKLPGWIVNIFTSLNITMN